MRPCWCIFVEVNLQRGGPNRVPLAWVLGCSRGVEALLGGPAVVGQDGVHDGEVVAVLDPVFWRRVLNEVGRRANVPAGHQVFLCCAWCGIW